VIALRVAESSVEGADVPFQVAVLVKDLFRCEVISASRHEFHIPLSTAARLIAVNWVPNLHDSSIIFAICSLSACHAGSSSHHGLHRQPAHLLAVHG
jgi:hypothetical protein